MRVDPWQEVWRRGGWSRIEWRGVGIGREDMRSLPTFTT